MLGNQDRFELDHQMFRSGCLAKDNIPVDLVKNRSAGSYPDIEHR